MKRLAAALATIVLATACGAAPFERMPALDSSPCQLPIGSIVTGEGGFLSYPGGHYSTDSASAISYSAKHKRWLSAPHQLMSPDGDSYLRFDVAKVPRASPLYAVDIATGNERPVGSLGSATPLAWTGAGIYFLQLTQAQPELWVLDPIKQRSKKVAGASKELGLPLFKAWTTIGAGAAWSKTVENTSGPNGDVLVRVDLINGRADAWYRQTTPTSLEVLGFSLDRQPLVIVGSGGGSRLLLLTGPGNFVAIEAGDFRTGVGIGVTDNHGLWLLASDGGVWLYRDRVLRRVGSANLPPPVASASHVGPVRSSLVIAGACS